MGGYNDLKTAITALIRTNDNQEITGATLQSALLSIINTIGQGSVFKGVATTSTNPGSPDANVFYIAGRPGYYPNFNLELTAGLHVIENKSGTWVNTEIVLDVVDAINIGGAKHVKPSQAMIIALQSVEQIPDSEGLANKMWWSTDGNLKYKQSDTVYNLGAPAYVLYYCGDKIYKWTGSGFREIGGGGTFASGEAVSNMSIFADGSDTEGKSSVQLAAMIPSGTVIRSLLDLIGSIDTSGGAYDGVDLITTFSYDAPTRVITVKQSGRQAKTIVLPIATSTNAGLMSSEDKTQLASIANHIGKTVNSFSASVAGTGAITITLTTSNGTPMSVTIPVATPSVAGLLTPEVKQQIVNISTKLIADNGLYNTISANGDITISFTRNDGTHESTTISLSGFLASKANLINLGNAGDMLDIEEWPRTVICNISNEDMPSTFELGDLYFVPRRQQGSTIRPAALWVYDGVNDVNLGAPNDKTIYCHKTTGNLYRWDNNSADFVQVGGSGAGTVTGVSVNNGQVNTPDQSGVINLNIPQSGLQQSDISLETQGDGVVDLNVGTDTYSLDLRHNHAGMAKLEKCVEVPSELQDDTIYVQVDNLTTPTEIQSIYLFGLEFVGGGGVPSTDPRITSPIGTQIDFNGESTKTVTVRASNLSEALTIAVTGVTANLQTISANDAANGVQLTLTKGQNFTTGTLRIYSSEVDKSWSVIDLQSTIAIKFTRQQYIVSDIYPGPNSKIEFDMKFDGTERTVDSSSETRNFFKCDKHSNNTNVWAMDTDTPNASTGSKKIDFYMNVGSAAGGGAHKTYASALNSARSTLSWDNSLKKVTFLGEDTTVEETVVTMDKPMYIGGDPSGKPYAQFDLIIYGIKHYENGVLTHNYVPSVYNGVAGLFDTINNQFIHSASGTEVIAINN